MAHINIHESYLAIEDTIRNALNLITENFYNQHLFSIQQSLTNIYRLDKKCLDKTNIIFLIDV